VFKLIVFFLVVGLAANLTPPIFYLKKAVGRDTQAEVTKAWGAPTRTIESFNGDGAVWAYKFGNLPPFCVEYILTFEPRPVNERLNQMVLSDWNWKTC
jgi:hypothetical protein